MRRYNRYWPCGEIKNLCGIAMFFTYHKLKNNICGFFQVYQESMPKECRCHGVSGVCAQSICWQSTPPSLKGPSMKLKELYNKAVKLNAQEAGSRHTRNVGNLNDTKLVYINDSPDYCHPNKEHGIFGTLNRECKSGKSENSCNNLCSKCGFRTHSYMQQVRNDKCNCKFHWCCKVTCEPCIEKKIISKCLPPA